MQASEPLLSAGCLTFSYDQDEKPILQNVSFQLRKGERALLLGPSGCGKSSLALCLNGLYPEACDGVQSGTVSLYGTPLSHLTEPAARSIGVVFQDPDQQFCMLTVEDEIAFGLENLQYTKEDMDAIINDVLEKLEITHLKTRTIASLSGGSKQKVALACIIAMEPELIILDEPTAQLDPYSARELVRLIKDLQAKKGFGLLVIEHQLDHWAPWMDRTIVLDEMGQKVMDGETDVIFETKIEELMQLGIPIPRVISLQEHVSIPFTLCKEKLFHEPVPSLPEPRPAALSAEDALSVHELSFSRGADVIFQDVSFSVKKGSITAIAGPNGTGKSTLLSAAAKLIRPLSGDIKIDGRPIDSYSEKELRRLIGYVFQNPEHQFVTDSVIQELMFGFESSRPAKEKALQLLTRFGLRRHASQHPFSLSQGQKRRLSVATMLMHNVNVLMLDEPTFGQDAKTARECMQMLREIQKEGTAVLMVTHDMELVSDYADTILVLCGTKLVFRGTPDALFSDNTRIAEQAHLALPLRYEWMKHDRRRRNELAAGGC
ncbi:ABC transporter ATP-binding protein [Bacillus velezensis]|uniref:ABC transporter ATP-binding protein n=1 Tax=Bacillus TaxID=1386 RepID=UPI000FF8EBAA|nr:MULTISPECIES: ABC transporter ATP-binding protein [Bacillus amyloliquefaciens group]QAR56389.1 HMP/thiamine ABC transporter ATP-binding protein [Bacillus velezensis]TKZ18713.1 ATP-binding cassette domain-containing protein [Bacillus velezensis]UUT28357.1 energy-coupling factor transporter ATPase [Bacillus velezensis]